MGIDDTAIAAEAAAAASFFDNFIVNHPFVIKLLSLHCNLIIAQNGMFCVKILCI
jgi:hypothetical protein